MKDKSTSTNIFTKPAAIVLLALLTCALWGSAFPAIKEGFALLAIEDSGSKILFAGYRFFAAGVLTFAFFSVKERRLLSIQKSSIPYIMVQGFLQTTVQYICFYIGLSNTTGTKGSVINGANGFFSIIAAHFMTRDEKMNRRKALGCAVGFAGIVVVNLGGDGFGGGVTFMGEGMVLLCSEAYGVSSVTLKMISHRESPGAITAYQLLFGSILLIAMGLCMGGRVSGFTLVSALLLLYLSVTSMVTFCIWANLLKYNPVSKITIYGFTIPVFGVMLSAIFLGEKVMTPATALALLLVSAGIVVVNRK